MILQRLSFCSILIRIGCSGSLRQRPHPSRILDSKPMTSKTRATLLEQLRDGTDPLAWDEFFQRYWPVVYSFARQRGCSDHTAEEIVQEVMLKVFEQREVFRYDAGRGRFRDWLGRIVRNQVVDRRRRPSERVRGRGGPSMGRGFELEGNDTSPDVAWQTAFENALLMGLLDVVRQETNPRDYIAFELVTLNELPPAEVATIMGISRNMVYKARRRVLKRLRELDQRIRQAIQSRPDPAVERELTGRIEKTMRSR